ncbi:MAG: xanthine dehydrogenase FAD-binding subunit XdhB [Sarcina sp.]
MYDVTGYIEPKTLEEALNILDKEKDLTIISGGTDVLVKLHEGRMESINLLSIREISGLDDIKLLADGAIEIGARATFTDIFRNEIVNKYIDLLAEAAVSMGGPQIRNIATIGGNVCNGAVSGDSAPSLFALNAKLKLKSKNGERIIHIEEFYAGPGKVNREPNELLVSILIEKNDYENKKGNYIKFATRKAMDISLMGVSVIVEIEGNKFKEVRIALGVAGPTPLRCVIAEEFAKGLEVNDSNIRKIANEALKSSKAIDFWNASKEYKENLIEELSYRAINESIKKLGGK